MRLKAILVFLCCLSMVGFAYAFTGSRDPAAQIKNIEYQIQYLQKEVDRLPVSRREKLQQQIDQLEHQIKVLEAQIPLVERNDPGLIRLAKDYFPHVPFVLSSPSLNNSPRFDSSYLITNWPSINEDLAIIKNRQIVETALMAKNIPLPSRPTIGISGYVEGAATLDNFFDSSTKADINLTAAELDVLANVNRWASAFMAITYNYASPNQGSRVSASNIHLDRGFLTVGNFNEEPFYSTIGQFNVPFGEYSSFMITDPYVKTMAKTKQRAFLLGFHKYNLTLAGYIFAGDSYIDNNNTVNNFGFNAKYEFNTAVVKGRVGAGFIKNIADSQGIQETDFLSSLPPGAFRGFSYDSIGAGQKYENLQHQVPAVDLNAALTFYQHYTLNAEYVTALRSFAPIDLSYNGNGALISGLNLEAGVSFTVFGRPSTIAAGVEKTWEALGLNLPKYGFVSEISTSILRDTVEKIEYRHDISYNSSDTASGGGMMQPITNNYWANNYRNVVTLHVDFYF